MKNHFRLLIFTTLCLLVNIVCVNAENIIKVTYRNCGESRTKKLTLPDNNKNALINIGPILSNNELGLETAEDGMYLGYNTLDNETYTRAGEAFCSNVNYDFTINISGTINNLYFTIGNQSDKVSAHVYLADGTSIKNFKYFGNGRAHWYNHTISIYGNKNCVIGTYYQLGNGSIVLDGGINIRPESSFIFQNGNKTVENVSFVVAYSGINIGTSPLAPYENRPSFKLKSGVIDLRSENAGNMLCGYDSTGDNSSGNPKYYYAVSIGDLSSNKVAYDPVLYMGDKSFVSESFPPVELENVNYTWRAAYPALLNGSVITNEDNPLGTTNFGNTLNIQYRDLDDDSRQYYVQGSGLDQVDDSLILGDWNHDKAFDLIDLVRYRLYLAGFSTFINEYESFTEEEKDYVDVDGDGSVILQDLLFVRKMLAGLITCETKCQG